MLSIVWVLSAITLCIGQSDHYYSNQIAVKILGGPEKARELAKRHACEYVGQVGSLQDYYLFEHTRIAKRSLTDSGDSHQSLTDDPEVVWLEQQIIKPRTKRDLLSGAGGGLPFPVFRPNLPNFGNINNINPVMPRNKQQYMFRDPLYAQQWYLHQGAHGNFDMNVEKAWRRNYTGRGISVSILDDGLQPNHPDLMQNYDPKASLDINGKDDDPTPTDDGNNKHGTRCAGEVAAVAGNEYCGVGIAFNSGIGGVRMLDGDVHDSIEATALSLNPQHIHIYSASWGPNDDGQTVDGPGPLAKKAFEDGIKYGRKGLGSVFVWASGNGGKSQDSCSCDGYTNSIYTISVSSAAQDGTRPWYLEECPSTLATTYSSGGTMQPSIVTTDLNMPGNGMRPCTTKHTGTSASAPLAAGIIALVLEANPSLNWRDLQYLTMLSARPEPLVDDWVINGVGRKVSTKFGYGLMDADRMVQLAEKWTTVPEQHICYTEKIAQPTEVKNGYIAVEISTDGCQYHPNSVVFLEHVQAVLSIKAVHRGALMVKVTSPMKTTSVMLHERQLDTSNQGFNEWPFMSVQSWGENPSGTWKIEVFDTSAGNQFGNSVANSVLVSWSMVLYGTDKEPIPKAIREILDKDDNRLDVATAFPEPQIAQQSAYNCHLTCKTCHGQHVDECNSCFKNNYLHNYRCLLNCPRGFYPVNNTMTCHSCPPKCVQCSGTGVCLACQSGYNLQGSQCVPTHVNMDEECLHGLYFDHRLTECKPCHAECLTCSGPLPKDCLSCRPPKLLFGQCLDNCPEGFTAENGTCVVRSGNDTGDYGKHKVFSSSSAYFLTATIACTVIISIGLVVFCCLQAMSSDGHKGANLLLMSNGHGPKYQKAPQQPEDGDDDDESDEEVETFSRRRLSDALRNAYYLSAAMSSKIENRKVMAIQARKKRIKSKKKSSVSGPAAASTPSTAATVSSGLNRGGAAKKDDPKNEEVDSQSEADEGSAEISSPPAEEEALHEREDEDEEDEAAKGSDEEEQEDPKDYRKGGYHPVKIGDYFNNRYHVVRKLGWGHFSTVWLCWDLLGKRFVALKVVKSASHYTETALDEIKLLRCVRDADGADPHRSRVVQLLDDFKISGINGTHVCMVFEVLGCNLLKLIIRSKYRGIPLENVRCIIRQVLEGLNYLHSKCSIIHTDIKPENILLCVDERDVRKLASETIEMQRAGCQLPASVVSTAPKDQRTNLITSDMSKKKRKRIKKKQKRQELLMQEQEKQLLELDRQASDEPPSVASGHDDRFTRHHDAHQHGAGAPRSPGTKERKAIHAMDAIYDEITGASSEKLAVPNLAPVGEMNLSADNPPHSPKGNGISENPKGGAGGSIHKQPSALSLLEQNLRSLDENGCNGILPNLTGNGIGSMVPQKALNVTPCGFMNDITERPDPVHDICDIPVKIADLGNACWTSLHFTEDIQTRQYRSLEVLIGAGYGPPADIWSTACMAFEMATGDYLFEPHSGDDYSRDEDHIAHIIELLGPIPRHLALAGTYSREYFTRQGGLRNISDLRPWGMFDVLVEKYRWHPRDAAGFSDFLLPMLDFDPQQRAAAAECLNHPWLTGDEEALTRKLCPNLPEVRSPSAEDGDGPASNDSSSDLDEYLPSGYRVDEYSDEADNGDASGEEEEDWQSVSEQNPTTRSSGSDGDGGASYPAFVTAHEVSNSSEPSALPRDNLDPTLLIGALDGGDAERNTTPILAFSNGRLMNGPTTTATTIPVDAGDTSSDARASDLENCDDVEVSALRK
ncbi:uncharacterized protein LOC129585051 [Paramacrobiotus metropolitanus]|uniref:uncharacterized protein LOC129585051 n=1 Tax=Paramacrobiotus metropolitanus TaxID=2943436 RepID=UPI002445ED89|nr:uncharacterized protein LOC129585051 [Paramacrobiotus metropolitanus]